MNKQTEEKWTKGPWIKKARMDGLFNIYHVSGVHDVALCVAPKDADLIAAAPEMVEALLAVVKANTYDESLSACAQARAALRKAGAL